jgi:hypothetical protein
MIKAAAVDKNNGRKIWIMGLSHANIVKLLHGDPIAFPGDVYGFPDIDFLIFAGEDEKAMAKLVIQITPDVPITEDPNPS